MDQERERRLVIIPVVKIGRKQALTYRGGKGHSELEIDVPPVRSRLELQDLRRFCGARSRDESGAYLVFDSMTRIGGNFAETQATRD